GYSITRDGLQTIGFNSNASRTGSLLYRQYFADDKAFRASANVRWNAVGNNLEDTTRGIKSSNSIRQSALSIALGIQKSLGIRPRLEPYVGVDLIGGFGSSKSSTRTEIINENKTGETDKNGDFNETINTNSTPFNFGLAPLFGVNYYILDGIAIGAEFSYGINLAFGTHGKKDITGKQNGTDIPAVHSMESPSSMGINFQNMGSSNITVSVYF
ncbi:MAG: hypothetical protein EOP00_21775, partial [Pedobacter sp.]